MVELSHLRLFSVRKEEGSRDVLHGTLSEFPTQQAEKRPNEKVLNVFNHQSRNIMLDKNDIQIIRDLFQENNAILKREIRDEMHSCIAASEVRTMEKMEKMKEEIIDGITDVLDDSILPRLEEHENDIRLIKRRLQLA